MSDPQSISIRPLRGSSRLKRKAALEFRDGTIYATDLRGRRHSFSLTDPELQGAYFLSGRGDATDALVDHNGRIVLFYNSLNWELGELVHFQVATGLSQRRTGDWPSKARNCVKLSDPDYVRIGKAAVAVGFAGFAAHYAPHADYLVYVVCLPALAVAGACLAIRQKEIPEKEVEAENAREEKIDDAKRRELNAFCDEIDAEREAAAGGGAGASAVEKPVPPPAKADEH